jgi:hypothetical protein
MWLGSRCGWVIQHCGNLGISFCSPKVVEVDDGQRATSGWLGVGKTSTK